MLNLLRFVPKAVGVAAAIATVGIAPLGSASAEPPTQLPYSARAGVQQVDAQSETPLAGMHMFGNGSSFNNATAPDSRRYYLVRGSLGLHGAWSYPMPVRLTSPASVHIEELGVETARHLALIAIGLMTPGYLASISPAGGRFATAGTGRIPRGPEAVGSTRENRRLRAGRGRLYPMATGHFTGQMTYYLVASTDVKVVTNCMVMAYDWDSDAGTVSDKYVNDCGSYGSPGSGWTYITDSLALDSSYYDYNSEVYFVKDSEYHHLNVLTQDSYDCEADFNDIEAIGHGSGLTTDNTSTLVPGMWSPDGSWLDCPNEYHTVANYTWEQ